MHLFLQNQRPINRLETDQRFPTHRKHFPPLLFHFFESSFISQKMLLIFEDLKANIREGRINHFLMSAAKTKRRKSRNWTLPALTINPGAPDYVSVRS